MLGTDHSEVKEHAEQPPSRRWSDRFPLDMEACVTVKGQKIWCEAVNISISGARVRLDSATDMSGDIWLRIPRAGVDCIAEIVWSDETDIGVKFKKKRRWYHIASRLA